MFRSIRIKLIFFFLLAVLTPLLVMRLIAYPTARKAIHETTINNLQLITSKKAFLLNDRLKKYGEMRNISQKTLLWLLLFV
ncbi:MAG: hypothetical protein M5U24_10320 [Candidatus Kuenenia sp.]|uniref:hypothetical protein n=1 Tax=Candidatus Kuenenia sp. TaxID=2499824 RepID=UPI0022BCEA8B|nr:hypothetical protein [Candidatus Kuenenia sp.]MCZ7622865.1 hypothetical protein [Candidatus Kuenenia sp.]